MATRANIGARLDALEQQRDQVIDELVDQYLARCRELIGAERDEAWSEAAQRWQEPDGAAADKAIFDADSLAQRLDAAYGALAGWRDLVDRLQGRKRYND